MIYIAAVAGIALILAFPGIALNAAKDTLFTWSTVILPSLLPFFILSYIFSASNIVKKLGNSLGKISQLIFGQSPAFIIGFFTAVCGGYPAGAKTVALLFSQGEVSLSCAKKAVYGSSVTSPMFVGAVCSAMLGNAAFLPFLLVPHYLAGLIIAAVVGRVKSTNLSERHIFCSSNKDIRQDSRPNLSRNDTRRSLLLTAAVESATSTLLKICAFMVLFGVLCAIVVKLISLAGLPNSDFFGALLGGALEMTTGAAMFSALTLSAGVKLALISLVISFSGFSIIAQTTSICADVGIEVKGFVWIKLAQGILAGGLTFLMYNLFG